MGILFLIIFGFVVGLLARAFLPGRQPMGFLVTTVLGIVGSFVGGLFGSLIGHYPITEFHTSGLIASVLGAMLVLGITVGVSRRRLA